MFCNNTRLSGTHISPSMLNQALQSRSQYVFYWAMVSMRIWAVGDLNGYNFFLIYGICIIRLFVPLMIPIF